MVKHIKAEPDISVTLTDEPERAAELAASGSCFITIAGMSEAAAGYVERAEDFEELSDEYIVRVYDRYVGRPYHLGYVDGSLLREADRHDYSFVKGLLQKNRAAVSGYDDELWTDDCKSELQFEKTIRDYYKLMDYGLWILEKDAERIGIFGLSAEDDGCEIYYILEEKYRHRGLAGAVVKFICDYAGEELGADSLMIRCNAENKPSRRLAEGLGFKLVSSEGEGRFAELKFVKIL